MHSEPSEYSLEDFERIAEAAVVSLPHIFRKAMENVRIVVENDPPGEAGRKSGYRSKHLLLGLYQGVPLTHRGPSYGTWPVVPDTITIFRSTILAVAAVPGEVPNIIRDTLIHEIGHHFGMSEHEIRAAGY
jgi:predicted Zn-dependent protease with MMP-like domain